MMNSALMLTALASASGLISENAMNSITEKPSRALNRMSVNGTKVPSSPCPVKRLGSCIARTLQHGDEIDLRGIDDDAEQFLDRVVQHVVLELQDERAGDASNRYAERDGHAS